MRLERRIITQPSQHADRERRDAAEQEAARRYPGKSVVLSLANGTYYASPIGGTTAELEA